MSALLKVFDVEFAPLACPTNLGNIERLSAELPVPNINIDEKLDVLPLKDNKTWS